MRLRTRMLVTTLAAAAVTASTVGGRACRQRRRRDAATGTPRRWRCTCPVTTARVTSRPSPAHRRCAGGRTSPPTMLDSEKVDTSDPEAVKKYYEEEVRPWLTGHAAIGTARRCRDADYFKNIIKKVKAGRGPDVLHASDPRRRHHRRRARHRSTPQKVSARSPRPVARTDEARVPTAPSLVSWQAFPTGNPPPPAVAPEDLAAYAYEVMDLKRPDAGVEPAPRLLQRRDPGQPPDVAVDPRTRLPSRSVRSPLRPQA